jgi:hypothetical protein
VATEKLYADATTHAELRFARPSAVERDLWRSLLLEEIARALHKQDELRIGFMYQTWDMLSVDAKAFFRERALMAVNLCDLSVCREIYTPELWDTLKGVTR